MAISIGDALLKLGVDTSDLEKDLNKASGKVDAAFNQWGKRAAIAGGVIVGAVLAIGGAAVKMAMEAVESENLFEVAMGNMAASTRAWSKELSTALGLNEFEVRKNVATIYTMLESMGLAEESAAGMSQKITELAVDMASFYNITEQDAFLKLRAGLTGEAEPLKRMGILVDENTVKMAAYQNGIAEAGKELTAQQKVEARYIAILEQTSKAQGDKARTMESPTNMLRTYKNQVTETATALGMKLLPAFTKLLGMVKPLLDSLGNLVDKHGDLAVALLAIAGGGGALLLFVGLLPKMIAMFGAVGQGITLFKVALTGLRAAFLTTQLSAVAMWAGITLGVSLAIAAGIALWQNWDKVSAFLEKAWYNIRLAFLTGIAAVLDGLSNFTKFIPGLSGIVEKAQTKIKSMMDNLIDSKAIKEQADAAIEAVNKWAEEQTAIVEEQTKVKKEALEQQRADAEEAYSNEIEELRKTYGVLEGYDADYVETKMDAARRMSEERADAIDRELDAERDAHDERLRLIDEEYNAKLKLIDEEAAADIAALNQDIDRIRAAQDAEDKAKRDADNKDRQLELEAAVDTAETDEQYAEAKARLDEFTTNLASQKRREERDAAVDALRGEIDAVRTTAAQRRDSLKEETDAKKSAEAKKLEATLATLQAEKDGLDEALEQELIRLETERVTAEEVCQERLDNTLARLSEEEKALEVWHEEELAMIAQHVEDVNAETAKLQDRTITITTVHRDVYEGSGGGGGGGGSTSDGLDFMAGGGMINEPTLLTRLRDMKPYAIAGEAGPEAVVPGGGGRRADIRIYLDGQLMAEKLGAPLVDIIRVKTGVSI